MSYDQTVAHDNLQAGLMWNERSDNSLDPFKVAIYQTASCTKTEQDGLRRKNPVRRKLSILISILGVISMAAILPAAATAQSKSQVSSGTERSHPGTRFAVIGYLYPTLTTPELRQELIDHVNQDAVDHVFILGDADLFKSEIVEQYKKGFNAPVHFAPGNHETADDEREIEEQHDVYLANVGYDNKVFGESDVNFITYNSGQDVVKLNAFLAKTFQDLPTDRPTVMLGHHRIWDDNRTSPYPNSQYKSYPFAEVLPALRENVDLIFSGNSARIYFGTHGFGKDVNDNYAYWCDIAEGVRGCSVGMKGPFQATYVVANVLNGEVTLVPRAFPIADDVQKVERVNPTDRSGWTARVAHVLRMTTFWLALGFGFIAGIISVMLVRRFMSRQPQR